MWEITLSDVRPTLNFGNQIVKYWHENRHVDQSNRMESPEINVHKYGQLVFDEGANKSMKKSQSFNKWYWENEISISKKEEQDIRK